jgi:hypothetical protein
VVDCSKKRKMRSWNFKESRTKGFCTDNRKSNNRFVMDFSYFYDGGRDTVRINSQAHGYSDLQLKSRMQTTRIFANLRFLPHIV